jgi:starvation-inducible DNA-binding protein
MRVRCAGAWRLPSTMSGASDQPPFHPITGKRSHENQHQGIRGNRRDVPKATRLKVNALLNQRLADAIDLQQQMKQAHWNVKGPNFIGLHKLFDEVYVAVVEYVDNLAERVAQLGGTAEGTVRLSAGRTSLPEFPVGIADGVAYVDAVSLALSTFGREVRQSIAAADELKDADTADLFTEISRGIDKWLWFIEAHHQAPK